MKKISLIAFVLCVSGAVFAQSTQPQLVTPMEKKVRFGVRTGLNMAKFRATDFPSGTEPDYQSKTAFHAGVFVNAPLGGMFAIQPGVEYSAQGSKLGTPAGTPTGEADFHYINVPIMIQYKVRGGFFLEAGPQVGFLASAEENDVEVDDDAYNKLDVSVGAGLGYMSRIGLGINGRFNYGLTNLVEGEDNDATPQLKNQVIQLGLVYQFGAHK